MKAKMINETRIEGLVYENKLTKKISGENSKNPGVEFINGTLDIATDNECLNIVSVHFTYVTAITGGGKPNATYNVLSSIIDGKIGSVMANGKENAGKVRIDSAIGLNEFYTDRNGQEELVSVKRNEGGFVSTVNALNEDESARSTFKCDMLITNVIRTEADPEKDIAEKVTVKGYIFDFRKAILPVEFIATNANAMNYFESLEASSKNPTFTTVWGRQISQNITRRTTEESAFGEALVKETTYTRKEYLITGASRDPYIWDDESTLTAADMNEKVAERETYLATVKQRNDEYKASRAAVPAIATTNDTFNF